MFTDSKYGFLCYMDTEKCYFEFHIGPKFVNTMRCFTHYTEKQRAKSLIWNLKKKEFF